MLINPVNNKHLDVFKIKCFKKTIAMVFSHYVTKKNQKLLNFYGLKLTEKFCRYLC